MKWLRRSSSVRVELDRLDRAQPHARATLESLPPGSRSEAFALFAAAPAERLFTWYDARPEDERRPYSLVWRPVLGAVWAHLEGDKSAYERISHALGEYFLSAYSNNGLEGPDDIDQDEAAAAFYAANCVIHGLVDFALLSSDRAIGHLENQAEVLVELDRQASDLALIASAARANPHLNRGVPGSLIAQLRSGN